MNWEGLLVIVCINGPGFFFLSIIRIKMINTQFKFPNLCHVWATGKFCVNYYAFFFFVSMTTETIQSLIYIYVFWNFIRLFASSVQLPNIDIYLQNTVVSLPRGIHQTGCSLARFDLNGQTQAPLHLVHQPPAGITTARECHRFVTYNTKHFIQLSKTFFRLINTIWSKSSKSASNQQPYKCMLKCYWLAGLGPCMLSSHIHSLVWKITILCPLKTFAVSENI